jgi:hypothetical protein
MASQLRVAQARAMQCGRTWRLCLRAWPCTEVSAVCAANLQALKGQTEHHECSAMAATKVQALTSACCGTRSSNDARLGLCFGAMLCVAGIHGHDASAKQQRRLCTTLPFAASRFFALQVAATASPCCPSCPSHCTPRRQRPPQCPSSPPQDVCTVSATQNKNA